MLGDVDTNTTDLLRSRLEGLGETGLRLSLHHELITGQRPTR